MELEDIDTRDYKIQGCGNSESWTSPICCQKKTFSRKDIIGDVLNVDAREQKRNEINKCINDAWKNFFPCVLGQNFARKY